MDEYAVFIAQTRNEMKDRRDQLRELVDDEGKEILDEFAEVWDQFLAVDRQVRELTRENGNVKARELSQGAARDAFDEATQALKNLVDGEDRRADQATVLIEAKQAAERIKLAARMTRNLVEVQRGEKNLILARSQKEMDAFAATIAEVQRDLEDRSRELEPQLDGEGKRLYDKFQAAYQAYLKLHNQVRNFSRLNSNERAFELAAGEGRTLSDRGELLLSRLTNKNDREQSELLRDLARANEKIKLAARINRNLTEIQRGEKNLILARSQQEMDEYARSLADIRSDLENRLSDLEVLIAAEEAEEGLNDTQLKNVALERESYQTFERAYRNYRSVHEEVREISRLNSNVQALERSTGEGRSQFDAAEATLKQLVKKSDTDMNSALVEARAAFTTSQTTAFTIAIIALIASIGIAFSIVRVLSNRTQHLADQAQQIAAGTLGVQRSEVRDELSVIENSMLEIQGSFNQVVDITNNIAIGNLDERLTARSSDDPLVTSINQMADNSAEVVRIANLIAAGELDVEIVQRSDQDQLAIALQQMVDNLRSSSIETQRRNWVDDGVAIVNETVRGEQHTVELANAIIEQLSDYLGAKVGALYIRTDKDEEDEPLESPELVLFGTYAYTERKNLANRYRWGESLVGQAAQDRKPILLSNVPDDYIKVTSGLGEAVPHHILVIPFMLDNEVLGVIELGTVEPFPAEATELICRSTEAIAIAFSSANARAALDQALKDSQSLTEELQTQQEELQETNEQLEEQTQALEVSQRDVEERNRRLESAQDELNERAEKLAQSSKYKSEFLANMSHELRTPLNSILLLSKMIASGDVKDGEEQRQNASVIHDAGSDLLGLINEVLDLSKIEAGKMVIHLGSIDVASFANSFSALFRPQAEEKGINFDVVVEPGLPETLHSDRDRLTQVLRNFLSNAMKFTEQGGITVRVAPVTDQVISGLITFGNLRELLRANSQHYLVFQVSDTGVGIPEEKRQLVFEAFQQADGSTSRTHGGTGLGLSISSQIADMLEGALALNSSVLPGEHGSTFSIVVPVSPSSGLQAVAEMAQRLEQQVVDPQGTVDVAAPDMGEPLRDDKMVTSVADDRVLLVIEDDHCFAQTLIDLGHKHGFKVVHASTGTEGVRLAEHYLPAAILLDVQLPIMDGWAVIRHLKKTPATSHIPVHMITVMEEEQFGYRLGAAQYLTKPVDPAALEDAFQKIETHLETTVRQLLVVEDNDIERESIIKLLQCDRDVQCTGVATGGEALEALRERKFDAFILDLRLPDMSGYEVLEAVANDDAIERIPTIVYTGKDLSLEEEKKLREYAESIVLKTAESPARLLEETSIFLHRVRANLSEEKQQLLAEVVNVEEQFKDRTILLVDDDIRNTFALSSVLEKKGLKIFTAGDGQEALEMLDDHAQEVDLVLMDIMMPVMDGYEATRKIRDDERFEKLPVIALTAKALKEDRDLCIAAGASDYMTKPIDYDQLFSLIRVWLSTMKRV